MVKHNEHFVVVDNLQLYRNGRVFDIREEKWIPQYDERLKFRDYSRFTITKNGEYKSYVESSKDRKRAMWDYFIGTPIPNNKKVDFKNKSIRGNAKWNVDNLEIVDIVFHTEERLESVRKKHAKIHSDRYKLLKKYAIKGYNQEQVMNETGLKSNQISKTLELYGKNQKEFFIEGYNREFCVSRAFKGKPLYYIADKRKLSVEQVSAILNRVLGINNSPRYFTYYRRTIRVLKSQGYTLEQIKKITLGDYKKYESDEL